MFRKIPIILLVLIALVLLTDAYLPLGLKQSLYAASLTIKSAIIMVLPFIIFSLLFKTMVDFSSRATQMILLIFVCVIISNTCATFLSHFIGAWVYHFDLSLIHPKTADSLVPAWNLELPKFIANDKAMFAGIIVGLVMGRFRPRLAVRLATLFDRMVDKLLLTILCLIPFFVIGFVVKLATDGVLYTIVKDYSRILAIIAIAQFSYMFLLYLIANSFNLRKSLWNISNILPAALTGFSTMSSASAMPLTIAGAEANAKYKDIAGATVPATVNIHLLGDCVAITIFAYAVMKSFAIPEPTFAVFAVYMMYFVIAKFSVAAVPGGGMLVMMPVLENYLGFNTEMLSLMTGLYLLFDPVITMANVFGNGAFALLMDRLFGWLFAKKPVL